jgi:hypothetical protein
MNNTKLVAVALIVSGTFTATAAFGQAPIQLPDLVRAPPPLPKELPQLPMPPLLPAVPVADDPELAQSNVSPEASGTTLSPPVTITYSGNSNALTIKDGGSERGLSSTLTNPANSNSAVFGTTLGSGAGVKGVNSGPTGFGGVFQVTDSNNSSPAVDAVSAGQGGIAIEGTNTGSGSGFGVFGVAVGGIGVGGSGAQMGVLGASDTGTAVFAQSNTGFALYASNTGSFSKPAILAASAKGVSIEGVTTNSIGVLGQDTGGGYGLYGDSKSGYGTYGASESGYGIYGSSISGSGVFGLSGTGYAGFFAGKVAANSFVTLSDRNAKTGFRPVNGSDTLKRISELPITSWSFKGDPNHRHLGPTAQDFHATFGLNGDDDTHISLSDSAGVSLAAIRELNKRLQRLNERLRVKDAQIAALERQVKSSNETFSARLAKLEQQVPTTPQSMTAYVRRFAH